MYTTHSTILFTQTHMLACIQYVTLPGAVSRDCTRRQVLAMKESTRTAERRARVRLRHAFKIVTHDEIAWNGTKRNSSELYS
jgi:hypothetical protein